MRKHLFALLFLVSLPLLGQQEGVSIKLEAPENVVAGSSFEVTLTFNKGNLKDYSRFSQDLPSGFTAENINSPNADFTFSDQRVRIIWLKLPSEQEIVVKYSIQVNERLSGRLELDGTFAYVNGGERDFLNLTEPTIVNIMANPDVDQSLVVDIKDFNSIKEPANIVYPDESQGLQDVYTTIVRQKPVIEANGIVYINVLIQKPNETNFLKLEESIPGGYSFESIEANGAVVSQAAAIARYVWMKPPAASVFLVKYRLVPILEKQQEIIDIQGTLSYTEDGATKVAAVREVNVNVEGMNVTQRAEYMKSGKIPSNLADASSSNMTFIKDTKVSSNDQKQANVPGKQSSSSQKSGQSTISDIPVLEEGTGVYFRIQVAALKNPYFAKAVFAEYDLLRDVRVEIDKGWSKYTVGPVSSYNEAQAMKKRIISETPVTNAFIVAYRNGRRVPLNEVM